MSEALSSSAPVVPPSGFGPDHWGTLLYLESVVVDCQGFQVGLDPRMKSTAAHLAELAACPHPRRAATTRALPVPMRPDHASRRPDGSLFQGHDDWDCLRDFAAAGLLDAPVLAVGQVLRLSPAGCDLAASVRRFKAEGGQLAAFSKGSASPPARPASP